MIICSPIIKIKFVLFLLQFFICFIKKFRVIQSKKTICLYKIRLLVKKIIVFKFKFSDRLDNLLFACLAEFTLKTCYAVKCILNKLRQKKLKLLNLLGRYLEVIEAVLKKKRKCLYPRNILLQNIINLCNKRLFVSFVIFFNKTLA